ncbi:MAG: hypothetical protein IJ743_03240 [Bacilli bacterium]|nr:hypothetical protein [Bacilli bacterium]
MKVKGIKGFNKNLTCRGFQYKEGETFKTKRAKACEEGFHFCEKPIDCLNYYDPAHSVYHIVEGSGELSSHDGDSKVACTEIKIGAKVDIPYICKATFDYVKSKCTNEHNAKPGEPATAGYKGAATAGNYGAATAGNYGAATAGNYGAATAGYKGAATAGDSGAATAGNYGAATAGYKGAATAGNYGAATARGSVEVGENGVGTVRGENVKIRGGLGAALMIAIDTGWPNYTLVEWKAFVVDGEEVKADTWYTLKNKTLVEV